MRTIYIKEDILKEAVDYINDEITFFGFLSHVKHFLKQLLTNPLHAEIDDYLVKNNLTREKLINLLIENGIVEKETKINDIDGHDKFMISYKIPKRNFERKMKRLYISLYEKNEITESILFETDCAGAMQGGGTNPDAGQFVQPLGKVLRRKIYVTEEQMNMLQEVTNTTSVGDYQYDVPFGGDKNDPAYNHKNMVAKGSAKKIGIRKKNKKL